MKAILFLTICYVVFGVSTGGILRIVGNDYATSGEFPYLVSIQFDRRHVCGGSLITKKHVLTAAHCVEDFIANRIPSSRIKVAVGTNRIPGGTMYEVDRIAYHPSYLRSNLRADVGVMRLKTEVTLSKNVRIIALPRPGQMLYDGQKLDVCGFGTDRLHGLISADLKKLTMYSTSLRTCRQFWPTQHLDGIFCATLAPGFGVCQGDSGGPVTVNKQFVIGIVSATSGYGCGTGIPDLITSVPHYLDFIHSEIARNY